MVTDGGNQLPYKVGDADSDAGGVYAGMNAYVLGVKDILVDKQTDVLFLIVHKSKHRHRAWGKVEEALHIFSFCKGKTGGIYL